MKMTMGRTLMMILITKTSMHKQSLDGEKSEGSGKPNGKPSEESGVNKNGKSNVSDVGRENELVESLRAKQ